jgi:hypothetical protein
MKNVCSKCSSVDLSAKVWLPVVDEPVTVNPLTDAEDFWCNNCMEFTELVDLDKEE